MRNDVAAPRINLYNDPEEEKTETRDHSLEVVPLGTDLEILLINSCKIDATKVQTIIDDFVVEEKYTTIFCMTETKVRGHDFQPEGVKIFSKHRNGWREKKGGGLALGYATSANVKLEELETRSNDILAVEGRVNNTKCRIVLCYFDCTKVLKGKDFKRNREIQKQVEKLMEVDPSTALMVLGDFNGRLSKLEPSIRSDANGKMIEAWVDKLDLFHLNTMDTCVGRYTFDSLNGRSAIDHILTNGLLYQKHIGMWVDEEKTMLNISDHNLVRAWFQIGSEHLPKLKKKPVKEITWISREPERIELCVKNFKTKIGKKHSFKKCMNKIKSSIECTMRRKLKKRPGGKKQVTIKAAPWVDTELIENIKLRSQFSREWRYARKRKEPEEVINRYKQKYIQQKNKTAILTGQKKSLWEEKKIAETWGDSKAFWKMIKELLGKQKESTDEAFIFTEEGEKKEIGTYKKEFISKWTSQVYQKLEKADFSFWYDRENGQKQKMLKQMTEEFNDIMENPVISEKELIDTINNMKNNKATGVDNIPAEVMKALIKDDQIREYLLKCFNRALVEEVHQDWLVSRTTMIPKNKKPKILEHRPIAVTVNSNKIVCTILRQKIEEHMEKSGVRYENQFGFTDGGRVEHCMFMLDYIANMSYNVRSRRGRPLYVAFIDFKKAYDSIDRKKLIEVLIGYKINPIIIDLIVQMYKDDHTVIKLGSLAEKVEVTGGIRQGCCISTLLFKLVTFKIIEKLREERLYKIRKYNDNSIWLADDATLIAEDLPTLKKLLECLSKTGGEYGLQINEKKTKIMKIKGPDSSDHIEEYEEVTEATYLGVLIGGRWRDIFEKENKKILEEVDRKVNTVMAEVKKSADKVVVGKAIWKLMAVPSIMFGRAVVPTCDTLIEALQRRENKIWRYLLDIGGYSTVDALRGEIGTSLVRSRVMETTLQYVRSVMNGKFENIKEMMLDTIEVKTGKWYNMVNSYIEELGIRWEDLYQMDKMEIKRMIRNYDNRCWEDNLTIKSTMRFYKEGKARIGYESCYRNNTNSMFLARARTNSLKLEEAIGRGNKFYNKNCKLCGQEEEDMVHFTMICPALEGKRNYGIIDIRIQDPEERMIELLFRQKKHQEVGKMIKNLWNRRKAILKYREEENNKIRIMNDSVTSTRSDPGPRGYRYTPIDGRLGCRSMSKG